MKGIYAMLSLIKNFLLISGKTPGQQIDHHLWLTLEESVSNGRPLEGIKAVLEMAELFPSFFISNFSKLLLNRILEWSLQDTTLQ